MKALLCVGYKDAGAIIATQIHLHGADAAYGHGEFIIVTDT